MIDPLWTFLAGVAVFYVGLGVIATAIRFQNSVVGNLGGIVCFVGFVLIAVAIAVAVGDVFDIQLPIRNRT